ncbi:MAG: methionine adenosyltransferase [Erysipelotrichaceae bacterium]
MKQTFLFTSESITQGHPDKICDLIADHILDAALSQDPYSKMAVEASIKDNLIFVYGEANTKANLDYVAIAKQTIANIGYQEDYEVLVKVNQQSAEIHAAVVQEDGQIGAGDQGLMFGYACDETEQYMPLAIDVAHKLAWQLTQVRQNGESALLPDGKTQVSVEYVDGVAKRIDTIVVSTQHVASITQTALKALIMERVIKPVVDPALIDAQTKYLINPSGSFVVGGSFGDSGTTGRKIVVDTYGGMGRIGGGCFSSKDPSKVDRSAAYYARYVAKNIVAAKLAKRCEIQVAYAIGVAKPVSLMVDTFGTGSVDEQSLLSIIHDNFDFSVANIIQELDLLRPIYAETACYGHFGRAHFPWERIKTLKIEQ